MSATRLAPPAARYRPPPAIAVSFGVHCLAGLGAAVRPELWPWAAGAIAGNHAFLTALGMWPRSTWLGDNMTRLPAAAASRREIAITFDDGPDPDLTPRVLEILDRHGARASFFCIAERAARHRELVREVVARGHGVENHSRRHAPTFAMLGLRGLRREISAAQAMLLGASGRAPLFFRAPAGLRSPLLDPVLQREGLRLVSWSRRGFDTRSDDVEAITRRLTRRLSPGDILLLHDGQGTGAGRADVVVAVLERVLDSARAAGLQPVALHEAMTP